MLLVSSSLIKLKYKIKYFFMYIVYANEAGINLVDYAIDLETYFESSA